MVVESHKDNFKGTVFDGLKCPMCQSKLSEIISSKQTLTLIFSCGCQIGSIACPGCDGQQHPILVAIGAVSSWQAKESARNDVERANELIFGQLGVE